jgi:hypothetical protein
MAEIKVQIKGDDSDVKAKFRETTAEARIFQESVTKSMEALTAASKNVISETGLGGIAKLLGAAGLAGAAVEFSHRLVSGFKDAVSAALDFGKQVGQLRSALGGTFGGQAEYWADQIHGISGAMGSFEQNIAIFRGLLKGEMMPQDAFKSLIDIQNASKATGIDLDKLGDAFAMMKQRGQLPERFFREFAELQPKVRAMGGGETPTVDWMFKTLLPGLAPGGLQSPFRLRSETSIGGQIAAQQEEFNKLWVELGQDLLPVVNQTFRELKNEMPDIIQAVHDFGEVLKEVMPHVTHSVHFVFGQGKGTLAEVGHPAGQKLHEMSDWLDSIGDNLSKIFSGNAEILKDAARQQKEAAELLHRAVNPR